MEGSGRKWEEVGGDRRKKSVPSPRSKCNGRTKLRRGLTNCGLMHVRRMRPPTVASAENNAASLLRDAIPPGWVKDAHQERAEGKWGRRWRNRERESLRLSRTRVGQMNLTSRCARFSLN